MAEGSVKCGKCRKLISRYDDLGKWRRNVGLWDDHTADADTFGNGCCWCRKCSAENKTEVKECQGTVFTHHNGGYKAKHGSTQFNQCHQKVANEGDFCEYCKGQTETYQQVKARIASEEKQGFEKYKQVQEKAQNYWNTLSSSEREKECERVVENMKLGKYWASDIKEGCGSGWTQDGSWWTIKSGKLTSGSPHLVPIQITEEFMEKEFGSDLSKALVLRNYEMVKKDNNDDKNNSPSPNPAAPAPQPITNSDSKKSDNSVNPSNSSQPNPGKDKSSEVKSDVKTIKFENNSTNPIENSPNQADNKTLIINLKNVKKITLTTEGNLVIEFDNKRENNWYSTSQTITPDQINNNQELQTVKNYLDKNNQSSLNQHELNELLSKNDNNSVSVEKPKDNNLLLIGGGIVGGVLIVVGIGIRLFLRKKKVKKN